MAPSTRTKRSGRPSGERVALGARLGSAIDRDLVQAAAVGRNADTRAGLRQPGHLDCGGHQRHERAHESVSAQSQHRRLRDRDHIPRVRDKSTQDALEQRGGVRRGLRGLPLTTKNPASPVSARRTSVYFRSSSSASSASIALHTELHILPTPRYRESGLTRRMRAPKPRQSSMRHSSEWALARFSIVGKGATSIVVLPAGTENNDTGPMAASAAQTSVKRTCSEYCRHVPI